jgi:hypothetical protein
MGLELLVEVVIAGASAGEEAEGEVASLRRSFVVWKSQSVEEVPNFDSRNGIEEEEEEGGAGGSREGE